MNLTEVKSEGTYDRHAISNIIGPMILRGNVAKETLHSVALLRLLGSCGLVAPIDSIVDQAAEDAERFQDVQVDPQRDRSKNGSGLHVLLVDDQANQGWSDWVRDRLPGADIGAVADPTAFVQEVQRQLDAVGTKDLRFRLTLPGMKEGSLPVLLLDLRLFSGNAGGELAFYRDLLLPLIARFTDRNDVPWPAFSSADTKFTAALNVVKAGSLVIESPEHHEALTWLPRVLSLIDLSLPIILFSSTGRRSIERAFSGHRNIILGFEKPRFFDSTTQSVQMTMTTEAGLSRAFDDAKSLLQGRIRARQALQCLDCRVDRRVSERYGHFELFIDESGDGRDLVVGGLVAGFASLDEAHEFDDRLVQAGVRYFPTLAGPVPPGEPLPKHITCRQQFEDVVKAWKDEGRSLLMAFVTLNGIEPFTTPLRFLDMDFMDNRWRLAVEAVIEVFISEIVARLKKEDECGRSASVSIYGPTRVSPAASQSEALMNQARFGTIVQRMDDTSPPSWGNHAVAESNLFHTACELLSGHCLDVDLEKAKFVRLQYAPKHCQEWEVRGRGLACVLRTMRDVEGDPADDYRAKLARIHRQPEDWRAGVRSLHYVCDQVLRDIVWRNASWNVISAEIPTFHESYDKFLRGNLAASRFLDTRRTVEAIVSWRPHATAQPEWRKGVGTASEAIGARLATALDEISGPAFMEASSRLRSEMRLSKDVIIPASPKPAIQGQSVTVPVEANEQEGEAAVRTTRYFVRLDNLPSAVTPAGLLAVAGHTSFKPVGCEVADDLDGEKRVAAIYFDSEAALTQVVRSLRRHGWQARPFITSERQAGIDPILDAHSDHRVDEKCADLPSEQVSSSETGCRLRVGPIPNSLDLTRVTTRVREMYPRALSIHHMGPVRGGGKYLLEFEWPTTVPTMPQDFIVCGHERLDMEFVCTGAAE